jgi:hypothetical protein
VSLRGIPRKYLLGKIFVPAFRAPVILRQFKNDTSPGLYLRLIFRQIAQISEPIFCENEPEDGALDLLEFSNHVTHSFGGHPSPFSACFLRKYFMVAQARANCELSLQLNEIHVAFSQFSWRAKIITDFFAG